MSKYFEFDGYWKDDKTEVNGIIKEFDDSEETEELDEQIFYYGMSENDIKQAIEDGENTMLDFVITSYSETAL